MSTSIRTVLHRIFRDNKGVTAIEYGLIAALISIVIIGSAGALGGKLSTMFENIGTQVSAATAGTN